MAERKPVTFTGRPVPPRPDASQALPPEALSWERLVELEPELAKLEREVQAYRKLDRLQRQILALPVDLPLEAFRWAATTCANAIWYGYGGYPGIKPRLLGLVGWHARNPALRSSAAYDLAYRRLYDDLPGCRNCSCCW